jgi:hypothetical protein
MNVVYACQSRVVEMDGARVHVQKGIHWPASDPVVQRYPELFSNDARFGMAYSREPEGYDAPIDESPVETATAAPGEKRSTPRRRPSVDVEF